MRWIAVDVCSGASSMGDVKRDTGELTAFGIAYLRWLAEIEY
jgi:hypothetical protein